MSRALQIANWGRFEPSDARKCKEMRWIAVPINHNGLSYLELMSYPDGIRMIGGWLLIAQVAAGCPKRGLLVADSGRILGAREISLKTRAVESDITDCIAILLKIGWLEEVEVYGQHPDDIRTESGLQDRTGQDSKSAVAVALTPRDETATTTATTIDFFQRAPGVDHEEVRAAIASGDPIEVVNAFLVTPGMETDWRRETAGMKIGAVFVVLAWKFGTSDPIRMPSGFKRARSELRELSQSERVSIQRRMFSQFGITASPDQVHA